jgi:hypothetical protein
VRAALLLALAALAISACGGGDAEPKAPRVVILGIDGFDWNIVDPLIAQGRMPVMKELLARGTRADLLTLVPLEKSPVIWTTIATGKLPAEKGRGFFVEGHDGRPEIYTAWHRRSRALWNILSERGLTVSVLGWLETWPAETVSGSIVSDYVQYDSAEWEKQGHIEHRTYPDSLELVVDPLIVRPKDLTEEDLLQFIDLDSLPQPLPPYWPVAVEALRWIYAGDLTFTALGCEFLERRPEDVVAIYLRGPDAVCHYFWGDRENREKGVGNEERVRIFGGTVDHYYEETDRLIGLLLERIDLERTTLFLISDHGFQGARRALDGSLRLGVWMHRELGTALITGPFAAGKGLRAEGLRVQDILPTLLHALGLPVADDMDGDVAFGLLGESGGRDREVARIPTYETGERDLPAADVPADVAEEIAERVRSLGYVE